MMYVWIVLVMLVVAGVVLAVARRRVRWSAVAVAVGVLVVLTIVFDNLMIAADLFTYGEGTLLGWYVGLVPVEDLAYAVVAATLLPALWHLVPSRSRQNEAGPGARDGLTRTTDPASRQNEGSSGARHGLTRGEGR